MRQLLRPLAKPHALDLLTVVEEVDDLFDHEVHVALGVHSPGNGQTHEMRLGIFRPFFPIAPEAHDANGSLIQSRVPANPRCLAQTTISNLLFGFHALVGSLLSQFLTA